MKRQLRLQRAAKRMAEGSRVEAEAGSRATVGMKMAAGKKRPTAISFGQAMCAAGGVEDEEPGDEQGAFDEVEADGSGIRWGRRWRGRWRRGRFR